MKKLLFGTLVCVGFFTLFFYYTGHITIFLDFIMRIVLPFVLGCIAYKAIKAVIETWGNKQ